MPWSPAEVALLWIGSVCGGVFVAVWLGALVEELLVPEVRHPYREDIPDSWWG